MRHTGDGFPLLARRGRHQRAGGHKQNVPILPALQSRQEVGTHYRGAAAAAGSAGIHLLTLAVIQHQSAIGVAGPQIAALFGGQPHQQVAAHLRQIAGDDFIVIGGAGAGIGKVLPQGIPGGRGRSQGCTMWKMFSVKFNAYSSPEARRF